MCIALSIITPKLLTCLEGAIVEPSIHRETTGLWQIIVSYLQYVSVLLLLSLKQLLENQALTSDKQ